MDENETMVTMTIGAFERAKAEASEQGKRDAVAGIVAGLTGARSTYNSDAVLAQASGDRDLLSRSLGARAALDKALKSIEAGAWEDEP